MKNRRYHTGLFVLMLFLCFMIMGTSAQAASYRQIAYINSDKQTLILKFKEFCEEGYTWDVTINEETSPCLSGEAEGGKLNASKMIKIPLEDYYRTKTAYFLHLRAKDNPDLALEVRYYSGNALTKVSVSKTSKDALKATATLKNGYKCNGEFLVFKGANSTSLIAGTKFKVSSTDESTTKMTASIAKSKLKNEVYKTYSIMVYEYDDIPYYGQGVAKEITYIKTQPKVTGLKASTSNSKVKLTWTDTQTASYYKVYQSTKKSKDYKCVASNVTTNTYTTKALTGNKIYYYKVQAFGEAGSKKESGEKSAVKSIKVPLVPGKVTGLKFAYDFDENLVLTWSKNVNTTGFNIYYKKTDDESFKKLGSTKNRTYSLEKLDLDTEYKIRVRAYRKENGKTTNADSYSATLTITPRDYIENKRELLLANSVRTIEHINKKTSIYTTRKYSAETKRAFINSKGYWSDTEYLIWISHYTQQITIFKGSQGNWKIHKTFATATGKASTPSPIGTFKTTYRETGWFYTNTKELYVTHWSGRNSFHTRPLYNDGSVCDATIGKPASHGCARCYNKDAKYIYDNIPLGTKVLSY